jgi:hypothetical protein
VAQLESVLAIVLHVPRARTREVAGSNPASTKLFLWSTDFNECKLTLSETMRMISKDVR